MCGILLLATGVAVQAGSGELLSHPAAATPVADDFAAGLARRGPDYQGSCQVTLGPASFTVLGSLLQLRGAAPSSNPHACPATCTVLVFNGEVFGGLEVPRGANDGQLLLGALGAPGAEVPAVLTGIRGPWAVVFWQPATRTLWYGRDPIGRRSLLLHLPRLEDGRLLLASSGPLDPTVPCEGFTEVPPGIYSISFGQAEQGGRLVGVHSAHPWTDPWVQWLAQFKRPAELMAPAGVPQHSGGSSSSGSDRSAAAAGGAAGGRTAPGPPHTAAAAAGMAGAGAIALAPSQQGVDTHSPAQQGQHTDVLPSIPFNMSPLSMALPGEVSTLESAVARMLAALRASMAVRCQCIEEHAVHTAHTAQAAPSCPPIFSSSSQPPPAAAAGRGASTPGACPPTSAECSAAASGLMPTSPAERPAGVTSACSPALPPAPVLILFSGGLDSTLMAALVHEALPPGVPIDLSSICFAGGESPDRRAALDALAELQQLAPERQWRLIQVDCSLEDVDALRPHLLRLLAPSDTVMDLNIGAALWLATRAEGRVLVAGPGGSCATEGIADRLPGGARSSSDDSGSGGGSSRSTGSGSAVLPLYRSAARLVLLGHGADELCGGYGRHRTKFREGGWEALNAEMALDMGRLWQRNLGRDDRLVADHGREARHPFLDEDVVATVLQTPLPCVADLSLPAGTGDKLLLRECARALGLPRAAGRVKRAIQFGTCLGQQANKRDFGSNRAANGRSAGLLRLEELPRP